MEERTVMALHRTKLRPPGAGILSSVRPARLPTQQPPPRPLRAPFCTSHGRNTHPGVAVPTPDPGSTRPAPAPGGWRPRIHIRAKNPCPRPAPGPGSLRRSYTGRQASSIRAHQHSSFVSTPVLCLKAQAVRTSGRQRLLSHLRSTLEQRCA